MLYHPLIIKPCLIFAVFYVDDCFLDNNCSGRTVATTLLVSGARLVLDVEFEDTNDALMFKLTWGGEVSPSD